MDRDRVREDIRELVSNGKLVVDFETGDIYSTRIRGFNGRKTLLPGTVMPSGYRYYKIYYKGVRHCVRGHHVVWWAAGNEIPEGKQIDHIDRDKLNNCLANLRTVTPKENIANTDVKIGELNPASKLTEKQAREIITCYAAGNYSLRDLADMYGVCKSQIHNIVSGKSWSNIEVRMDGFELTAAGHRRERLKAMGNAIVPLVAAAIMAGIKRVEAAQRQKEG